MLTKKRDFGIEEGDVVLIHEEGVKRNKWKLGKIEEVIAGADGIVRGANVKTCHKGKIGHIKRPLQKLYPLEISSPCTEGQILGDNSENIENVIQEEEGTVNTNDYPDKEEEVRETTDVKDTVVEVGDSKDDEQCYMDNEARKGNCSGSLGSSGVALGEGAATSSKDEFENLISSGRQLRSKRIAAVDGQIRRRIKDIQKM